MACTNEGQDAENMAHPLLKQFGYKIQQADWIGKKDGEYTIFEIKHKEIFTSPPYDGTGTDVAQVRLRMELYEDLGLKTMLWTFIKGSRDTYYQYLHLLEIGEHFDTSRGIRIYPLKNFKKYIR